MCVWIFTTHTNTRRRCWCSYYLGFAWSSISYRCALPRPRPRGLVVTWRPRSQSFICNSGPKRAPVSGGEERTEGGRETNKAQLTDYSEKTRARNTARMSEEKPKVRYKASKRCRFVVMAQSSSCQTVSEMCNLKWPGLHVSQNRRSVCFANEWVAAHPYLRLNALAQRGVGGNRSDVVPLTGASKIGSRNTNYTMIAVCGFFFFFFSLCRNGTTLMSATPQNAATAAATKKTKKKNPSANGGDAVLLKPSVSPLLSVFLMLSGLQTEKQNQTASGVSPPLPRS